jgi:hypothetical protein
MYVQQSVGRDRVIIIAIHYELGGLAVESRWGSRLSLPVQTGPRVHPSSFTVGTGSVSPRLKRPLRGADNLPISSAEDKARLEPYFSPSGPSGLLKDEL